MLILSSCSPSETNTIDDPEPCEECQINPFPEGLVLPQIYIQGKLYWTTEDIDSLYTNIIDPIVAYYESENQTVVSISVTTDDLLEASINSIIVRVLISNNDGDQDPLQMDMLVEKVSGTFPLWVHETVEP